MDPNATLANIRLTASLLQHALDNDLAPDADQVQDLLEQVAALDEWLSRGGFRPADWTV